jgi:ankyrin repeat protein
MTDSYIQVEQVLLEAIRGNDVSLVNKLISVNSYKQTAYSRALAFSSGIGDMELTLKLISLGADVNFEDGWPLYDSAVEGHINIVQLLVENGADVTCRKSAALRAVSETAHTHVLKYLLNQPNIDVHADKDCAIHWALAKKKLDNVGLLAKAMLLMDHAGNDFNFGQYSSDDKLESIIMSVRIELAMDAELGTIGFEACFQEKEMAPINSI